MAFAESMRSLMNLARAFGKDHFVFFVYARESDILYDFTFSDFLAPYCKAVYFRYRRVGEMITKKEGMVFLFMSLENDEPAERVL